MRMRVCVCVRMRVCVCEEEAVCRIRVAWARGWKQKATPTTELRTAARERKLSSR